MHQNARPKSNAQTQIVLSHPDVFIGSIKPVEQTTWIIENNKMVLRTFTYPPGLLRIFQEVIMNVADSYLRDNKVTTLQVHFSQNGSVSVSNDGNVSPFSTDREGIAMIETVFGELRQNMVQGRRRPGIGAKLVNIFSSYMSVQVGDYARKEAVKIDWNKNMSTKSSPIVMEYEKRNYIKVIYTADFARFGVQGYSKDLLGLMQRRLYDIAALLKIRVIVNKKAIGLRNFTDYVSLYVNKREDYFYDSQQENIRWRVAIAKVDAPGFHQISFVNCEWTKKGGTHVDFILERICYKVLPLFHKKIQGMDYERAKPHMLLLISTYVESPSFDNPCHDALITKTDQIGSLYQFSLESMNYMDQHGMLQPYRELTKREAPPKRVDLDPAIRRTRRIFVPKLEDAYYAGTSTQCTLIVTEGDAGKALALYGIENINRDFYGIYPLKGKGLNTRDMSSRQIGENTEYGGLIKALGLQHGRPYDDNYPLRYSNILLLISQDGEGSTLKGLIINFFQTLWPGLCDLQGFIRFLVLPLVRCKSTIGETRDFLTEGQFRCWWGQGRKGWEVKYLRGLGALEPVAIKEMMADLSKWSVRIKMQREDDQILKLAFHKKNLEGRKKWMQEYDPEVYCDYSRGQVKLAEFIEKDLVHSIYAQNLRAIPSCLDGLRVVQRKVLYYCMKRGSGENRVVHLAGKIMEEANCVAGQATIHTAIIAMNQDYVGSNNISLLEPKGIFGTRHGDGKDHAPPRELFTSLSPLTRLLFHQADDWIVPMSWEQGRSAEPRYYLPILPLILINGCDSASPGVSTTVYAHRVADVIEMVRDKISRHAYRPLVPGWQNYKGCVSMEKKGSYMVRGAYEIRGTSVKVTEIPINKSVREYKNFLEQKLIRDDSNECDLQDLRDYHTNEHLNFQMFFFPNRMPLQSQMERYLKLSVNIQQNNMILFSPEGRLKRYNSVGQIMDDYYECRLKAYQYRKEFLISKYNRESDILTNKINFIREVLYGTLNLSQPNNVWASNLRVRGYKNYEQFPQLVCYRSLLDAEESKRLSGFGYLLKLPIDTFTSDKLRQLQKQLNEADLNARYYKNCEQKQLWLRDIEKFETEWKRYRSIKERDRDEINRRTAKMFKERQDAFSKLDKLQYSKNQKARNPVQDQTEGNNSAQGGGLNEPQDPQLLAFLGLGPPHQQRKQPETRDLGRKQTKVDQQIRQPARTENRIAQKKTREDPVQKQRHEQAKMQQQRLDNLPPDRREFTEMIAEMERGFHQFQKREKEKKEKQRRKDFVKKQVKKEDKRKKIKDGQKKEDLPFPPPLDDKVARDKARREQLARRAAEVGQKVQMEKRQKQKQGEKSVKSQRNHLPMPAIPTPRMTVPYPYESMMFTVNHVERKRFSSRNITIDQKKINEMHAQMKRKEDLLANKVINLDDEDDK